MREKLFKAVEREGRILEYLPRPWFPRLGERGWLSGGPDGERLPFFVMERLPGVPLLDHAAGWSALTPAQRGRRAAEIVVQVCQALEAADDAWSQRADVVGRCFSHRDLNPGNVLVSEDQGRPSVHLIDFGTAAAPWLTVTVRAEAFALAYAAPEQFQVKLQEARDLADFEPEENADDRPWDVWTLGVLLFRLVTGALPFSPAQGLIPLMKQVIDIATPAPPLQGERIRYRLASW